ncbi:MAG: T9SS type A sorting domain-containing protein [candidate division Zixibacteria bacterium]|nr:T9SS type A sorting domain-containing protein [candidate division Zixibacteria bacterium]
MKKIIVIAVVIVVFSTSITWATIIYVPGNYETIQEGINASIDGDTVLVGPNTYNENINYNGHRIVVASHYLTTGNTAFINSTIIDGGQNASVVSFLNMEDTTTILTGFTIRNGNTTDIGGGIYCWEVTPKILHNKIIYNSAIDGGGIGCGCCAYGPGPIIDNNEITNNTATDGMGGGISFRRVYDAKITNNTISYNSAGQGGGIGCDDAPNEFISNNTISYNTADSGGGIYCYDNSAPLIDDNAISSNTAIEYGGGVFCSGSSPTISNNTLSNNSADDGGGIYCFYESNPEISDNTISNNTADDKGAGVYVFGCIPSISDNIMEDNTAFVGGGIACYDDADVIIYGNTISGNSAETGGAILSSGSIPTISNNVISGNSGSYGKGIACVLNSNAIINNNLITGNLEFGYGGGIYCASSDPQLDHNTIALNSAFRGGAIYCLNSDPVITNTILWGNIAVNGSEFYLDNSNPIVTYSDVEGGWIGEGNLDIDPLFCDSGNEDFFLAENSACVGAGQLGTDIGAFGVGCDPIYSLSCNLTILTPNVPAEDGYIEFDLTVENDGSGSLENGLFAELYPVMGDCANGVQFDFNIQRNLETDPFGPGDVHLGYYYFHVNNVGGAFNQAAIIIRVGAEYDNWQCETCDEFNFLRPWNRSNSALTWIGSEWLERKDNDINVPTISTLTQNFPNPFNATTGIPFDLAQSGHVSLEVYNLSGQLVETLIDGQMSDGSHIINWDASTISSGIYFYKLITEGKTFTKRMSLLK